MDTPELLRRRLDSTEGLRSIVRTMKTLAAANIHAFESAARAVSLDAETVELGLRAFLKAYPTAGLRLEVEHVDRDRIAAVVVGSDQGMCGAFNERVASWTADRLADLAPGGPLLAVGERVRDRLRAIGRTPERTLRVPGSLAGVSTLVETLLLHVDDWRQQDRFARLVLFHNRRLSGAAYRPRTLHLYPVPARLLRRLEREPWPERGLPTFTMKRRPLLSALTREFLFVSLFRAVIESMESENASRLGAMEAAERNIDERLEQMRQEFRTARQSSITAELLDIVTGYEATGGARGETSL